MRSDNARDVLDEAGPYTQLSNPVSNRIYQRLGYRPVREDLAYRFGQISVSDRATGIAGRLP